MKFFVGLHHPADAQHFERAFVSINAIRDRKSDFPVNDWILDSGAFTEISQHGRYRHDPSEYAEQINRWAKCGNMLAAVSQDWMCEPWIIAKTGLSVMEHQIRTIHRYVALLACTPHYIMPVIQGYTVPDYLRHIAMYRGLLKFGAWVGVGSICKRNGAPLQIQHILQSILRVRPDLRLHTFGLKTTAFSNRTIRAVASTGDSMAWSSAARHAADEMRRAMEKELGQKMLPAAARAIYRERGMHMPDPNDWREAKAFETKINSPDAPDHGPLFRAAA